MKFVPVPVIGGPTDGQPVLFSVWHTRVRDYEPFVKQTNRPWPKPDFEQGPTHPAVNVSGDDAQLFCQWLNAREKAARRLPAGWRYRLPSDHEWSCAVGLGAIEDAAELPTQKNSRIDDVFPWGAQWPPPRGAGNYAGEELQPALAAGKFAYATKEVIPGYDDGFVNTSPVGSFAANRLGLFDMGGNVWQWCEDWLNNKHVDHVLRGASWGTNERRRLLLSHRYQYVATFHFKTFGFRCVLGYTDPRQLPGGETILKLKAPAPAQ
jgi:formylglycine-generating enzyme required for sulfatase activity